MVRNAWNYVALLGVLACSTPSLRQSSAAAGVGRVAHVFRRGGPDDGSTRQRKDIRSVTPRVGQSSAGAGFGVDRCNPALHQAYDALLAPYRLANPPPLPAGVLVVGGPSGPSDYVLAPGENTEPYESIFVINDGRFIVTGSGEPPANISSKIVLLDQAMFIAWDANVHFVDRGVSRHPNDMLDAAGEGVVMIEAADAATVIMAFSSFSIGETRPGYLRLLACGTSSAILAYNDFSVQDAICESEQTRPTTEVFPFAFDQAVVTVVEQPGAQSALYEVNAGGNGVINLFDLEDPGAGAYFVVDAEVVQPVQGLQIVLDNQAYRLLDAEGNGPSINAVNCGLLWGFWIEPGARIRIEDSQIGLWFKLDNNLVIEGLNGGLWGENGVPRVVSLPEQQVEVALTDSHVVETNVYFRGPGTKWLNRSVVGDANCGGSGVCVFGESVITGAGGDYSTVFGDALSIYGFSSQRMGFFARDHGVAVFHYTTIEGHPESPVRNRFRASEQALIALQNAIFAPPRDYSESDCPAGTLGEYTCEVEDDGAIAYATIAWPGYGAIVSNSQEVIGTAAVNSSPEGFWAFDHYDLWLTDGEGNTRFLVQGQRTEVASPSTSLCRADTAPLGFLDVNELSAGSLYTLHLAVFNQFGWIVAKTENSFVYYP